MSPAEIYLQKARAKYQILQRNAEELPPQARAFASEVLAELSLAFTMLESERSARPESPRAVASMRTRAEMISELMQEAAFFRAVAENLPTGLAVVGEDGRVLYINPAGLDALGMEPDQLMDWSALDFVHPEDAPVAQRGVEHLLENPEEVAADVLRIRQKDGSWIQIKLLATCAQETSPLKGLIVTSASAPEERAQEPSAG